MSSIPGFDDHLDNYGQPGIEDEDLIATVSPTDLKGTR